MTRKLKSPNARVCFAVLTALVCVACDTGGPRFWSVPSSGQGPNGQGGIVDCGFDPDAPQVPLSEATAVRTAAGGSPSGYAPVEVELRASELLEMSEGVYESPAYWVTERDDYYNCTAGGSAKTVEPTVVDSDLPGTTTTVSFEVTRAADTASIYCDGTALSVSANLRVSTADGALDESVTTPLYTELGTATLRGGLSDGRPLNEAAGSIRTLVENGYLRTQFGSSEEDVTLTVSVCKRIAQTNMGGTGPYESEREEPLLHLRLGQLNECGGKIVKQ